MPTLKLTKHHGLGNDFLVLVDPDGEVTLGRELARWLCDRHRGVGADGVVHGALAGGEVRMTLRNADGGRAEMSGNGVRCLAQAVVDAGLVPPGLVPIRTDAGVRAAEVGAETAPGTRTVRVGMGIAGIGPDQPQRFPDRRARRVDMGNPHLVLLGPDPRGVDVATLGPQIERVHPGGINVEFVMALSGEDALVMRVWERGVGETQACGTGACAAAAAAHEWGLVGRQVAVHQPGGTVEVELGEDGIALSGPVQRVARIEVDVP